MSVRSTAAELMNTEVVVVSPDDSVLDAAQSLLYKRVSNAPVVRMRDKQRVLRGFICEKDCMSCFADGRIYSRSDLKVSDIMRVHPMCIRPQTDLFTLATIFMQHGFRHLPVVEDGVLLGVVSRRDALEGFLAHHAAYRAASPEQRAQMLPDFERMDTRQFIIG
ncbi:MAG: CBS domain-containing protein [Xanthomonadales bacterium]|nr:CBS domain-containing protein [Xanthomonadales bacterium]